MPRITAEMRAEIRAIARERVALRHQLDTLRLDYAEMFEEYRYKRDKPKQMLALAAEIEDIYGRLQEVNSAAVADRFGLSRSKVSQLESARLYLRSIE
jgi:uncharacterized protein (DUF169 family)